MQPPYERGFGKTITYCVVAEMHTISAWVKRIFLCKDFFMNQLTRRNVVKGLAATALITVPQLFSSNILFAAQNKILIVYFSRTGNTRTVAHYIQEILHCDILKLMPKKPYPEDYNATVKMAKEELKQNARPKLATKIPDLTQYNTIFVGYPNWWGTMPMLFFTFFESVSVNGKTIIPFCTHGGSGLGDSERDIAKLCPKAILRPGLAIKGTDASIAKKDVASWLSKLGLAKTR